MNKVDQINQITDLIKEVHPSTDKGEGIIFLAIVESENGKGSHHMCFRGSSMTLAFIMYQSAMENKDMRQSLLIASGMLTDKLPMDQIALDIIKTHVYEQKTGETTTGAHR